MSSTKLKRYVPLSRKLLIVLSNQTKKNINNRSAKLNYRISDKWTEDIRFSKSLIKQILFYAAICDSEGKIEGILTEDIAKGIGFDVRTVQNNNEYLKDKGIINTDHTKFYWRVNITLLDYTRDWKGIALGEEKNHEKESHGGYILVTDTLFKELLAMDQINSLRVAIGFILHEHDTVTVPNSKSDRLNKEAILSYEQIKGMLPSYLHYKEGIKKIVEPLKSIFNVDIFGTTYIKQNYDTIVASFKNKVSSIRDLWAVGFQLDAANNGDARRTAELNQGNLLFRKFYLHIEKYHVHKANITPDDLNATILEFGLERFNKALEIIKEKLDTSFQLKLETPFKIDRRGILRPFKPYELEHSHSHTDIYNYLLDAITTKCSVFLRKQLEAITA